MYIDISIRKIADYSRLWPFISIYLPFSLFFAVFHICTYILICDIIRIKIFDSEVKK